MIPVRSEREALDWSLVLASQGIEAVLERHPDDGTCFLTVSPAEHGRAVTAIRHYVAENRQRLWRQELPWKGLVYDWRNIAWFVVLVAVFVLSETLAPYLRVAGVMDDAAVRGGEWWRLFTATMLHADLGHLVANVTTGVVLLGLAMGSFGAGFGLLAAFLAGVGGNLAGLLLYPETHRSLGASGMVMGALGLLTAQSISLWRTGLGPRQLAIRGMAGGMLLLILLGLSPEPQTDVIAHLGGFGAGLILGIALSFFPSRVIQSLWCQRSAEVVCLALAMGTWWLALK